MKLLLDENLSRRLVPFLLTAYPESTQVVLVGLEAASDVQIWEYAKSNETARRCTVSDMARIIFNVVLL